MPNQRRAGQMFLGFQADKALVRAVDSARGRTARSVFIREALGEKLKRMKVVVDDKLIHPPDRAKQV